METLIRKPKLATKQSRWGAIAFDGRNFDGRLWQIVKGSEKVVRHLSGYEPNHLWYALEQFCSRAGPTWICGFGIYEFLCWADFYKVVDSGRVNLIDRRETLYDKFLGQKITRLVGCLICENPPTIIDVSLKTGAKLKFLDPRNWGITPDMVTENKEDVTLDDTVQAVQDYISLVENLDMGSIKTTAASQGWYCFRRSHMRHELYADDDDTARKTERAAYYAGRCEAFKVGRIPEYCYHLDVTSMYSSFAYHKRFPTKLEYIHYDPKISKLCGQNDKWQWIADVTLQTDIPHYPLRYDGKVIYPVGEFRTTLAWPELSLAIDRGHIRKVHIGLQYRCNPIFFSFAKWYMESREKLDSLGLGHLMPALKLIVNSTYGKIGQRSKLWQDIQQEKPHCKWGQWYQRHPEFRKPVQFRSIDGHIQYLDASGESPIALPSISATMCSYGRAAIDMVLSLAGRENCFYLDTDGVMVNQCGFDKLAKAGYICDKMPGKLKIREQGNNVQIFGLKHYLFGERYCCAGIPDRDMVVRDDSVSFEQHLPFSMSLWNHHVFPHGYQRITRKRTKNYRHGHVLPDGYVLPWVIAPIVCTDDTNNGRIKDAIQYKIMGYKDIFDRQPCADGNCTGGYTRSVNRNSSDNDSSGTARPVQDGN